jgi:hypothetical protein
MDETENCSSRDNFLSLNTAVGNVPEYTCILTVGLAPSGTGHTFLFKLRGYRLNLPRLVIIRLCISHRIALLNAFLLSYSKSLLRHSLERLLTSPMSRRQLAFRPFLDRLGLS